MHHIYKVYTVFLLFIFPTLKAQQTPEYQKFTWYYLANMGAHYQQQYFVDLGADSYLIRPNNDALHLGINSVWTFKDKKLMVIPEIQAGYLFNKKGSKIDPYSPKFNAAFYVGRVVLSPYYVRPEIGISVVDMLELTAGYAFEYRAHKNLDMSGIKLGINFRLPLLLFFHD